MPVSEKKIASDDGKRGRPKKSGKVVEVDNSEDLFAGLVKNSLSENEVVEGETCKITDKQAKAEKLAQEKAEKKAALEAEKLAKAEKQAQEKAEKEAKKLALEKERAEKKAALEAAKAAKEAKKGEKVKKDKKTEVKDSDDEEEIPEVGVKKFEINGKIYLRSNTNVLYDLESQDEIGVWNEAKQEIEFGELEEEEEEE
jgi:membrane protein involved in colicin uptake